MLVKARPCARWRVPCESRRDQGLSSLAATLAHAALRRSAARCAPLEVGNTVGRDQVLPSPARFSRSTRSAKEPSMPEHNRIAIVTGGSRGLGANTVTALAKRGVNSIFTYHSGREEADKMVATVAQAGARAIALPLDTGEAKSFDALTGFPWSRRRGRSSEGCCDRRAGGTMPGNPPAVRPGTAPTPPLERFPNRSVRCNALGFCFDAFSSREPVSTSLENPLGDLAQSAAN